MRADEAKITAGFGRHGALWVIIDDDYFSSSCSKYYETFPARVTTLFDRQILFKKMQFNFSPFLTKNRCRKMKIRSVRQFCHEYKCPGLCNMHLSSTSGISNFIKRLDHAQYLASLKSATRKRGLVYLASDLFFSNS